MGKVAKAAKGATITWNIRSRETEEIKIAKAKRIIRTILKGKGRKNEARTNSPLKLNQREITIAPREKIERRGVGKTVKIKTAKNDSSRSSR